jgi:hypothetical protein
MRGVVIALVVSLGPGGALSSHAVDRDAPANDDTSIALACPGAANVDPRV